MKIVYFSDTFYPKIDGVAISMKNFAEALSFRGHEFLILCPRYGEGDFVRINDKIRVERFRSAFLPSYPDIKVVLPSPNKIKRIVRDFKPDIAHIHTPGLLGLYGLRFLEKEGIPTIGTYHTLMAEQDMYVSFYRLFKLDKLFGKADKFKDKLSLKSLLKFEKNDKMNLRKKIILKICNDIYNRCDLVISPSHLIKKQLIEYGIDRPITVVSNGMDLQRFKGESKKAPTSAPKILHVGRISYEKNCDVVLHAFHEILNTFPDATLTIIGDGPAIPSLKKQAESLGMKEKIIFTGFVPNTELPAIYPEYDLFLTASTMETQGLVILESLACGLPAVGVDSFAIPELIHDGKNGFVVPSFDAEGMAAKSVEILKNPEMYEEFSKESLKIASHHEMGLCVDQMEEVYKKMASLEGKVKKKTLMDLFMDAFTY